MNSTERHPYLPNFESFEPAVTSIATAADHVRVLHSDAKTGTVSLAQKEGRAQSWRERRVSVGDLERRVSELDPKWDTYLSQARFAGRRQIVKLITVRSLWSDLDTYKVPTLAGLSDEALLACVIGCCEKEGLPYPSYVLSTGRGLCVVWLHETLPRLMLPRWQAAQAGLHERLTSLGPNPQAREVARVLRLVGSINTKSGRCVRCLYPLVGSPEVFRFKELEKLLSPLREPWQVRRARELLRGRARRPVTLLRLAATDGRKLPLGSWPLWDRRLTDLEALRRLRWGDEPLPPANRDLWLFISTVALSWTIEDPAVLRREVLELGREALGGAWPDALIEQDMAAALNRAEAAARGELIEWPLGSGCKVDPRYHYGDRRIIEVLGITAAELAQLPETGQLGSRSLSFRQAKRGSRGGERRAENARSENEPRDAKFARLRARGWAYRRIAAAHVSAGGDKISGEGVRQALLKRETSETSGK